MAEKIPAVGEKLDIEINGNTCVSKVYDIGKHESLIIYEPTYMGAPVVFPKHETVKIYFYKTSGASGKFSFDAVLKKRFKEKGMPLLEITRKSLITKYQRREYARVETLLPVDIKIIAESVEPDNIESVLNDYYDKKMFHPEETQTVTRKCFAIDVSGGGMRLAANEEFAENSLIECELSVEGQKITANGVAIKSEPSGKTDPNFYVRVRLLDIDEHERRRIIKYVFEEQIRQKRIRR